MRREGDTQDFVQEALIEVLRDGPRFAVDNVDAFRALLARIVENTLIDRQRYMHRARRDRAARATIAEWVGGDAGQQWRRYHRATDAGRAQ